jgi:hypothetical protein
VRSGRAFLYETIRETWQLLVTGAEVPEELTAVNRLTAATAVDYSVQAVDLIFALGARPPCTPARSQPEGKTS